ncbi:hypothetical protein PAXRUDRAFT_29213 [Paxillus rubicundulus Ve08.2h10]|uniref:Uncharacterized protein n=1 Tax=Paxillus rubicundulus Ve08.2h10 TaxID=930991 RepID=A0A0D0D9Q8_9AGAM|nr:hypothetical protein PAXRUDRAFT_29213 [Paxillus rubicundulus Ve08.2h10]
MGCWYALLHIKLIVHGSSLLAVSVAVQGYLQGNPGHHFTQQQQGSYVHIIHIMAPPVPIAPPKFKFSDKTVQNAPSDEISSLESPPEPMTPYNNTDTLPNITDDLQSDYIPVINPMTERETIIRKHKYHTLNLDMRQLSALSEWNGHQGL